MISLAAPPFVVVLRNFVTLYDSTIPTSVVDICWKSVHERRSLVSGGTFKSKELTTEKYRLLVSYVLFGTSTAQNCLITYNTSAIFDSVENNAYIPVIQESLKITGWNQIRNISETFGFRTSDILFGMPERCRFSSKNILLAIELFYWKAAWAGLPGEVFSNWQIGGVVCSTQNAIFKLQENFRILGLKTATDFDLTRDSTSRKYGLCACRWALPSFRRLASQHLLSEVAGFIMRVVEVCVIVALVPFYAQI